MRLFPTESDSYKFALLIVVLLSATTFGQTAKEKPRYRDSKASIEDRVTDLLSRMTLEEKIAQLQSHLRRNELDSIMMKNGLGGAGPVLRSLPATDAAKRANALQKTAVEKSRLGIPLIIHDEALHGLVGNGATAFPQSIGLASSWDPDLMKRVGSAIGRETRSRGIRQVLAPVINIARDVRWGRVEETYGEDPFLTSRMAVAYCSTVEAEGVITTPKHFVANYGDGGRDSYPASFSERELREVYFPPFKACFREANAGSVMASYNSLDGVPCSASKWLLTDILRTEWGFTGFVVSDYGSVWGIKGKHAVAATEKEAAARALQAGLDVELPNIEFYGEPLLRGARDGTVPSSAIDAGVRNVLRAKFRLGLFENPYVDPKNAEQINDSEIHRELARQAAREAIVLLRNEHNILPLSKNIESVAVIGPNADSVQLGGYSGFGMKTVSVLEGIKNKVGKTSRVTYAKGCEVGFTSLSPIPSENLFPLDRPGEHGLRGEYFMNKELSGKPKFVRLDKQIHFEWAMGSPDSSVPPDHFSVRWTGKLVPSISGTYLVGASTDDGVRVYLEGKLLIDSWFDRGATLDVVTLKLEAGHQYDVRIEYYENEGWSYASFDWELKSTVDPRMAAAVDAARNSDVAILVTGIIEGEGYDRANLDLPGRQEQLIRSIAGTGTPTIVVLVNGSAITMKSWADSVAGIVEAWYPGEEGGNAIADVLFGDFNPAGRLPITFPQFVGQVPLYFNHKPTGRGDDYSDMSGKPLFPFGFGLSYTTFEYSNLRIAPEKISAGETFTVNLDIRNTGTIGGDEVVQLYTHDPVASVTRPVKELKAFTRIHLQPAEKRTVSFTLGRDEFSFLNEKMQNIVEPGSIEIMIGSSSEDIRLKGTVEIRNP